MDLQQLTDRLWELKKRQGFNTTNIEKEFLFLYEEVAEAHRAYRKALPDLNEELADIFLFLLSVAKMNNVDLEQVVEYKMQINEKREYKNVNGANIRVKG